VVAVVGWVALLITVVWLVTCGGLDAVVTAAVGDSLDFGTSVVVIAIASPAVSVSTVPDKVESVVVVVVVVVVVGVCLQIATLFFFNKSFNSLFSLVADSTRVFNRWTSWARREKNYKEYVNCIVTSLAQNTELSWWNHGKYSVSYHDLSRASLVFL